MITLVKLKQQILVLALLIGVGNFYSYAQTKTACANSDFSMGNFTNWVGHTSIYPYNTNFSNVNTSNIPYYYRTGIVNGRQTILTTSTPDPFTCNNVMTLPPGERVCVRLGNGGIGAWGDGVGWQRDYLDYTFSITPANALLLYKYAIVMQDPTDDPSNPPHQREIRPRFIVTIKDAAGKLIDPTCGYKEDYVDSTVAGFRKCLYKDAQAAGGNAANQGSIMYRAWTTVGVDLRKFIGQNITIGFETWDCGLGGHFGYAYLTAKCDSLGIIAAACTPDGSVKLTAPDGFAYKWIPSGETTKVININNAKPGDVVSVELTTISGCKTTLTTKIYPLVTKANYIKPATVCLGNPVTFKDSSYSYTTSDNSKIPIVDWLWNFGDGLTSNSQNPNHVYKMPGDYKVTLRVTNKNGCMDSIAKVVKVLPAPIADFSFEDVCVNSIASFTDLSINIAGSGTITNWDWTFADDNSTSTIQHPKHTYNTSGTFAVKLKVTTDSGCSDDTVKTIKIYPVPLASYTATEVCIGDTTAFTDKSTPGDNADNLANWIYNFGDNSALSSDRNPRHAYGKEGTYKTSLIVTTVRGCVGTAVIDVNVHPRPTPNFSATPLCLSTPVQFTDLTTPPNTIAAWYWSFGDYKNNTSTLQNPTFKYDTASIYKPKLVVTSKYGCIDSITIPLDIPPLPYVSFDANRYEDCVPLCVEFVNFSFSNVDRIVKWNWNFGDGNSDTSKVPKHCYTTPGIYTVSLQVSTANGCMQDSIWNGMMKVYDRPKAGFSFTPEVPTETTALITFNDEAINTTKWKWDFGDGAFSTDRNPNHLYLEAKKYTIWQYVSNDHNFPNCTDQISRDIIIKPSWTFYVPNAFTPNKDGKNTGFIPKGHNITQFQMWIFDRWGDMIYTTGRTTSPDTAVPWDGRANGGDQIAQEDVYVWLVELRDINDMPHKYIGHVSIIK